MYSIFNKKKSKQVFQNEHHNNHTCISYSQRPDEQQDKNVFKTNHASPTMLMPESSSTNNPRTIPAQAETSTIVIPKTAIVRIIWKKGNKINKIKSQNNVKITTALTVGDYQDVKITRNTNSINNTLKEVIKIVLCKNFSSNYCTYDPDCKF